jgi:hypothetical protein
LPDLDADAEPYSTFFKFETESKLPPNSCYMYSKGPTSTQILRGVLYSTLLLERLSAPILYKMVSQSFSDPVCMDSLSEYIFLAKNRIWIQETEYVFQHEQILFRFIQNGKSYLDPHI